MFYDPQLLDKLSEFEPQEWSGRVWRYMFAGFSPHRANNRGARWNPPEVSAIYTALERSTCEAELGYRLGLDVVKPRLKVVIYEIEVSLHQVLDLRSWNALADLGLTKEQVRSLNYRSCQEIGGAVAWLEHDGVFFPSARSDGTNLVIYPTFQRPDAKFEILSQEQL
jgi:RES domain-containing protein